MSSTNLKAVWSQQASAVHISMDDGRKRISLSDEKVLENDHLCYHAKLSPPPIIFISVCILCKHSETDIYHAGNGRRLPVNSDAPAIQLPAARGANSRV